MNIQYILGAGLLTAAYIYKNPVKPIELIYKGYSKLMNIKKYIKNGNFQVTRIWNYDHEDDRFTRGELIYETTFYSRSFPSKEKIKSIDEISCGLNMYLIEYVVDSIKYYVIGDINLVYKLKPVFKISSKIVMAIIGERDITSLIKSYSGPNGDFHTEINPFTPMLMNIIDVDGIGICNKMTLIKSNGTSEFIKPDQKLSNIH